MITTVYRIQNEIGEGSYQATDGTVYRKLGHDISYKHPSPGSENLPIGDNFICGFKDIKQLNNWFEPHEIELMSRHGFKIIKRQAAIVHYGKSQITFIPLNKRTIKC